MSTPFHHLPSKGQCKVDLAHGRYKEGVPFSRAHFLQLIADRDIRAHQPISTMTIPQLFSNCATPWGGLGLLQFFTLLQLPFTPGPSEKPFQRITSSSHLHPQDSHFLSYTTAKKQNKNSHLGLTLHFFFSKDI